MMRKTFALLFLLLVCQLTVGHSRERQLFTDGWLFALADSVGMSKPDYQDSQWRRLDLPHDWAIEGDFHATNPSGANGGALPGGIGWYRKHFTIQDLGQGKRYFVEFDGVYMNSSVYINGHKLGERPYGYIGFEYDLTPYLVKGDNVIAVKVDNLEQPNSRWYAGCGIYRNVWFTQTEALRIAHWGVHVQTTSKGQVSVNISLVGKDKQGQKPVIRHIIYDANQRIVARHESGMVSQRFRVKNPRLWSIDNPYIYKVKTEVIVAGKVVDEVTTTTGFRDFRFDSKTGFWLNGKNLKINGVCDHHDLGCLGSAINTDALVRKLRMLKEMGCNAIRCSHNPPAPELLDLCDTMGFIVMDESFDMWRQKKTTFDYALFFDQWAERDLSDLVLRDRNHPSILMWSIGNEVLEQWNNKSKVKSEDANILLNAARDASALHQNGEEMSENARLTIRLADIVRKLDTTRPITAGCNEPSPQNHLFKSGALDIIGFNYHHKNIKDVPANFPGKPFIMSESVSALQTRGYYMMPSDSVYKAPKAWWLPYTDPSFSCSAYDNMHASWSSTHEATWDVVKHTPYVSGQFIWTGWDYIGEPTPYNFPARSSYFGIIDLAGFPKDVYYMYQSEWTDKPVLHLFPHWNWMPGQTIDMWCYYNQADEVELFVNGQSAGIRKKGTHDYHVMWRVKYAPGTVKVVARKDGQLVREQEIHTAGNPDHLRMKADRQVLQANGKSLAFVTIEVVDKDGNVCPDAGNQLYFSTEGDVKIAGVDNGCQYSLERFKDNKRKAFNGRCLVVLQSGKSTGEIQLRARGVGLKDGSITLQVR
uniref:Beta-galactosidase GalB n=1 Tax=Prevotella sp. GTC17262 TaxID=3236797 RepID=A0AB33JHD2_9BACT